MAVGAGGPADRVAVGLVGAGKGGLALLDLLLTWPRVSVAVVVDPRRDAPALAKATTLGIPTAAHHLQVFAYPVTLILEVTGQPAVLDELLRAKPPGVEIIGAASLRFFWDLLEERTRLEAERGAAEARVAEMLDSAADAILSVDEDQRLLVFNQAAERLYGYRAAEILGQPLDRLIASSVADLHPQHLRGFAARPERAKLMGARQPVTCRRRDGSEFPAEVTISKSSHGGRMIFTAIVRDLTERRRSEEEIRHRQREAEVIAGVARTINASLDLNTILQKVTDAARELCRADVSHFMLRDPDSDAMVSRYWARGDRPDQQAWRIEPGKGTGGRVLVTGRPFRTDDYEEDPRITKDYVARVRQVGIIAECVVPIRVGDRIDGLLYVDNMTRRPFTDRDEAVLIQLADHAAVAIQNARVFAESERRRQAAASLLHLNQVVSASLDIETVLREITQAAVALMDVPGVSLWVAAEETQMLERRAVSYEAPIPDFPVKTMRFGEGLVGWVAQHRQIVNVDDAPADARLLKSEWWRAHHLVSFLGIPIESEGKLLGVLALIGRQPFRLGPDDTALLEGFIAQAAAAIRNARLYEERTRAYEDLIRAQNLLVQAQKLDAMGRFAGGIAHDFNNLLVVIIGRTELLLNRLPNADPARRPVELIRTAGERAAALTHQLLAFSRKQVLQPTVLDLSAVVANAQRMLRRLIGEDIHLVTLRSPLPCAVKADAGQLEQVIFNLAVNARDAMPQGGQLTFETTSVELDAAFVRAHPGARAGPHTLLVVSDTGEGMTPEVQQHIFEPFFTTKEPTKGTGLGLATVFGIVKQHEGYITVESNPGQGATFRIYLPQVEAVAEAAAPTPAGPVLGGTETLLLVEDEDAVRDLAREILTAHGYTVVEARHPGEALLIGERRSTVIDLLLTDIVMPEMNGRELAERLTALRAGLKVVYMTGYPKDAVVQHGIQETGVTLLQKPFTPAALARAVREVLDGPAARDEAPPTAWKGGG